MVDNPYVKWEEVLAWSVNALKGKSLKVSLCKLAFGIVIFHLWKQKNDIRDGNVVRSEEQILKRIDSEMCTQIMGACKFKKSAENVAICC
jgi:hypothetical protein